MPNFVPATYQADDGRHQVVVERAPTGHWRVLDVGEAETVLVEELSGYNDGQDQAESVARDYAREAQLFHAGRREQQPLGWRAAPILAAR